MSRGDPVVRCMVIMIMLLVEQSLPHFWLRNFVIRILKYYVQDIQKGYLSAAFDEGHSFL